MAEGKFGGGDGTEENPYLIEDEKDLDETRNVIKHEYDNITYFKQVANINLDSFDSWEPIEASYINYNGNNFTINNLKIKDRENIEWYGLFGAFLSSDIYDLGIKNVDVKLNGSDFDAGTLIGYLTLESSVKRCFSEGNIAHTGNATIGGLIGFIQDEEEILIEDSYTDVMINAYEIKDHRSVAGGLIGAIWNFEHEDEKLIIKNVYASGNIFTYLTDESVTGGIIGLGANYDEENIHVSIENSLFLGEKIAFYDYYDDPDKFYGSVLGTAHGVYYRDKNTDKAISIGVEVEDFYVLNNFEFEYRGDVIADIHDDIRFGFFHHEVGSISIEDSMKRSTYKDLGWDFDETWSIVEGITYPLLTKSIQCKSIKL